jgi:acyl dehydratase
MSAESTPNVADFPRLTRRITADMVRAYGRVNGDRNMIHYDAAAARAAGYADTVVHGAITAAILGEACHRHFGADWPLRGELRLTFIQPLYVGDSVTTCAAGQPEDGSALAVWCENGTGERIAVGMAALHPAG